VNLPRQSLFLLIGQVNGEILTPRVGAQRSEKVSVRGVVIFADLPRSATLFANTFFDPVGLTGFFESGGGPPQSGTLRESLRRVFSTDRTGVVSLCHRYK